MDLVTDLHLHSKYARAVSSQMTIPGIARMAKRKGIGLMAAPDWTHPLWLQELKANLVEKGEGVYECEGVKFLLVTEIASIYSQGGKGRRIHNLVFAPSLAAVEKINAALQKWGANLLSDGRPIVGLSAKDLLQLVLEADKDCLVVPAHIWTPWFSLYGSVSGFDSIEECFGDLGPEIKAIETGLSSDPKMNWRIKELDSRAIVSFSDAHSLAKMGREATVFKIQDIKRLRYEDIKKAIEGQKIAYTIEFYPEEGKYHYTGHRKCAVKQTPQQTKKLGETCPVCGKKLTVGVMHRVEKLASRSDNYQPSKRPKYKMLVPLAEIIAEAKNVGVSSLGVLNEYNCLTDYFGSEFKVLLEVPVAAIAKIGGERIAEGINKVRKGDIFIDPGYDGVYGRVKIWFAEPTGKQKPQGQMTFF